MNKEGTLRDQIAKVYEVGTLRYTKKGLIVLFVWLLCGDFAFTFFEAIFGRFIPLYLKDLQASNTLIGVMTGSIAGAVNLLFLPNLSQASDRYRSPLGRRIPLLYIVAPLTVGALILVGFAPEIGGFLHHHFLAKMAPGLSETVIVLSVLSVFVVAFHFFNMVLVNAFNWLLRDVVPEELMARFLSWFRIVGTASSFLFLWLVFPHVLTHRREVCVGVGLFYLVIFFLMCRNVKEGEYPPPPPADERPGVIQSFILYFRECLRLPIYRNFFLAYVLVLLASSSAGPFSVLFARNTLALSMEDMSMIFAWGMALSAVVYFPVGWLCDKFSPLSIAALSLVGFVLVSVLGYFFVQNSSGFLVYTLGAAFPAVGWGLGQMAATMKLLPTEKFGQLSSALNVFGSATLIFGNYLIGKFMDLAQSDYRLTFLWSATFYILAIFPLLLVYRDWKRHGGPLNYIAPLPT